MKKTSLIKLLFISSIVIAAVSCKSKYTLSKEDYKYLPYKGNETLVFQSNFSNSDTFCLTGYSTSLIKNNTKGKEYLSERYTLNYNAQKKYKDPYASSLLNTYLFMEAHNNKKIMAIITLWNTHVFENYIPLDSVNLITKGKMKILNQDINDIIEVPNLNKTEYKDSAAITKMYWSKSIGLVGYDKLSGENWRLVSKE